MGLTNQRSYVYAFNNFKAEYENSNSDSSSSNEGVEDEDPCIYDI